MEESSQEQDRSQVGLGIDLVDIARMRTVLARTPSFSRKVFSESERAYCDARANPESHYATRFAAKEAVVKALGCGFTQGISVRDIEVARTASGQPRIVLHGRAAEIAREQGVLSMPVSLSFTHNEAVACVMAITEQAVKAMEERVDPMKELARQFKEVRGLLDDIDELKGRSGAQGEAPEAAEVAPEEAAPAPAPDAAAPTGAADRETIEKDDPDA